MKRLLAIVILAVAAAVVPVQTALAGDGEVPPVVGDEPVLIEPEPCTLFDVTGDGIVDIADVTYVVSYFGTRYYVTDIGQVVADFGLVCF